MSGFSFIRNGLIQKPVGNNMANDQEDVFSVKRALSSLGHFGGEEPNGFITRRMDHSIKTFQRDSGLKVDGILLPGGETETALLAGLRNANTSAAAVRQAPEEEQADPDTKTPPPPPRKPNSPKDRKEGDNESKDESKLEKCHLVAERLEQAKGQLDITRSKIKNAQAQLDAAKARLSLITREGTQDFMKIPLGMGLIAVSKGRAVVRGGQDIIEGIMSQDENQRQVDMAMQDVERWQNELQNLKQEESVAENTLLNAQSEFDGMKCR